MPLIPSAANSAEFAALDESKVDVKEMFIHRWVESQVYGWCRPPLVHDCWYVSQMDLVNFRFLTQRRKGADTSKRKRRRKREEDYEENTDWMDHEEESYSDIDFAG